MDIHLFVSFHIKIYNEWYKNNFLFSIIWRQVLILAHCFQTISHNYHNAISVMMMMTQSPPHHHVLWYRTLEKNYYVRLYVWEEVLCKSLGLHYYQTQAVGLTLWTARNDENSLDDVVFLCLITSCTRHDINIVLLYILLLLVSSLFAWPCNLPSNERIITNNKQCCEC